MFVGLVSGSNLNLKQVLDLFFSKSCNVGSRKFNFNHSFENGICDIGAFLRFSENFFTPGHKAVSGVVCLQGIER